MGNNSEFSFPTDDRGRVLLFVIPTIFVLYCLFLACYRLLFSPISQFPGPKLAGLTWWYEFYYDVIKYGQFYKEIDRLHTIYGPVVRINPTEIHVKDPDWYNELYTGASRPRDKSDWFIGRGGGESAFGTVSHSKHRQRRSVLNPFFSKQAVTRLQPMLQAQIDQMSEHLRRQIGKDVVDIWQAYFALNLDIISDYAFGKPMGLLEEPDFGYIWRLTVAKATEANIFLRHFRWLGDIMFALPDWLVVKMNPAVALLLDLQKSIRAEVVTTFSLIADDVGTHRTIFQELRDCDLPPEEKKISRVTDEAVIVIAAGSETTAKTLAVATYNLLNHPEILRNLVAELDSAIPNPSNIISLQKLEKLDYLRATILESHRISSVITGRLIRSAPTENLRYHDWIIPAGTPISMDTYYTHFDPAIFPDPEEFQPERFLNNSVLEKYVLPFSKGSRSCIGINLANAELYLTIATVFRRFEMELYDTSYEDVKTTWDNFVSGHREDSRGVRVRILKERT